MKLADLRVVRADIPVRRPHKMSFTTLETVNFVFVRAETSDGLVELFAPALQPGQTFAARYRVIPTLGGTLRSGASSIEAGVNAEHVVQIPPTTWTIK